RNMRRHGPFRLRQDHLSQVSDGSRACAVSVQRVVELSRKVKISQGDLTLALTTSRALHGEHAASTKMTGEVLLGEGCKLGYMSDDELLLENLTVRETLRYALLLLNPKVHSDVITRKVESAAKQVGLERCVDTFVKNISWGE